MVSRLLTTVSIKSIFFKTLFQGLFILSGLTSCSTSGDTDSIGEVSKEPDSISGTDWMAKELKRLVEEGSGQKYYHWNSEKAKYYKSQLANKFDLQTWYLYCFELLNAGDSEQAIIELEKYLNEEYGAIYDTDITNKNHLIYELLALAYLRMGEQKNCQINHNGYSCILPLKQPAIHTIPKYSENAVKLYTMLLQYSPNNFKYVWLLNLADMTIDGNPLDSPKSLSIDFPNWEMERKDFPYFENVAMKLGVAVDGLSGGSCMEDFNNDGYADIFATSYGMSDQVKLFFSNGDGSFTDKTAEAGLTGIVSGLNSLHADYNNDGFRDILILRGAWLGEWGNHPNSLLRNNGDGTFTDVTRSSGLLSYHPTQTAAWADYNVDGHLDLFIGNEALPNSPNKCELYINNGDGTFSNKADELGFSNPLGYVKGVTAGDINNDGWPDIYVSILNGTNKLFVNNQGKFQDIGRKAGVQEPIVSFPTWFFDFNNDGFDDIFVSAYSRGDRTAQMAGDYASELITGIAGAGLPKLYLNNRDNTFKDVTAVVNLNKSLFSMGSNYGDLDNDGYLDFYVGTGAPHLSTVVPNRMFRNVSGQYFEEVTSVGGFGHIQKGHGVSFGDVDLDGDQDIYMVLGGAVEGDTFMNALFENPGNENNWISIKVKGVKNTRDGIGTKIVLTVRDRGGKPRRIVNTVSTGGSFGSNTLAQEIGIGKALVIDQVLINWPDRQAQIFSNIPANQRIEITEGESDYRKID